MSSTCDDDMRLFPLRSRGCLDLELNVSHFQERRILVTNEKHVLPQTTHQSGPHALPIGHPAQPDPLINVLARSGIQNGQKNVPHGAGVHFKRRGYPQEIPQVLRRSDLQPLDLLEWHPDIVRLQDNLKYGRKDVISVTQIIKPLSLERPMEARAGAVSLFQQRSGCVWTLGTELVERMQMQMNVGGDIPQEIRAKTVRQETAPGLFRHQDMAIDLRAYFSRRSLPR
jgi:hypothetical protein